MSRNATDLEDAQHRVGALHIKCSCGQLFFRDLVALGVHLQLEHKDKWPLYVKFMKTLGKRMKGHKDASLAEFNKILNEVSLEVYGTDHPNLAE